MDNATIFASKEKIAVAETSIATVTAVINDNWSQVTLNDAIVKFFNNSTSASSSTSTRRDSGITPTVASTNSTIQHFFNTINDWNIFEEIPWFIWILIGVGTSLIVIIFIAVITYLLKKSKNKKSRRSSGSDQRITDSSDNITQFMWPRWMLCCPKSIFDRQENLRMMRQNSASNLDPYRRPPLPPVYHKDIGEDEFHSNFLLSHLSESLSRTESHLSSLAGKAEYLSTLVDDQSGNGGNLFAINMTGIQGVPVMPVQNDRRRPLPVPPPGCFNHL
uniref:Uncharacterized protein n=1 Tax=Elaeophora elaphi TaxID=1147741 RepID=A0A0R3S5J8_9BILA